MFNLNKIALGLNKKGINLFAHLTKQNQRARCFIDTKDN